MKSLSQINARFVSLFCLLFVCGVAGGGGTGLSTPNLLIFFVASICLAITLYSASGASMREAPRYFLVIVAAIWVFPVLQLLPLPPGIWTQLPGHDFAETVRSGIGEGNRWQSFTIGALDTWVSLFGVSVFAIVFFAGLSASRQELRSLLWLVCGIAFANIFIGAFQVASGGQIFDFHGSGHRVNLIGFFANRNHTALFLAASMPLLTYLVSTSSGAIRPYRHYAIMLGLLVLFTGVVGTTSRAGLAMGIASLALSIAMIPFRTRLLQSKRNVAILAVLAVAVTAPILASERFAAVLQRFDTVSSDLRWSIWEQSWVAAQNYLPFGSGFGTFRLAYDPVEPLAMVSPQFVNNAHNEYLELLIEGGYPAMVLLLCAIVAIFARAFRVAPQIWRLNLVSIYTPAIMFAVLAIAHSTVDYPVRRLAIAAPLALLLAILCRNWPTEDGGERQGRQKSRRPE